MPHSEITQISQPLASNSWLGAVHRAAFDSFDEPQSASAAALVGAATRLVFTSSGSGMDTAAFGSAIFAEVGFDTRAVHAAELRAGQIAYQPGDLAIGIDADSETVAGALRRAHNAGLHTVGVTTRGLTIIDADVLLYVPVVENGSATLASTLSALLGLALLAARVEPASAIAADVGRIETYVQRLVSASGRIMAGILFSPASDVRVVFAGCGSSRWMSRAIANHVNRLAISQPIPFALDAQLEDVRDGFVAFQPSDILVLIDPYDQTARRRSNGTRPRLSVTPERTWAFTAGSGSGPNTIHLPGSSPAIASLAAFISLVASLTDAGSAPLASS